MADAGGGVGHAPLDEGVAYRNVEPTQEEAKKHLGKLAVFRRWLRKGGDPGEGDGPEVWPEGLHHGLIQGLRAPRARGTPSDGPWAGADGERCTTGGCAGSGWSGRPCWRTWSTAWRST